jgi:hypothetical protein
MAWGFGLDWCGWGQEFRSVNAQWTLEPHIRWGVSWTAEWLSLSQNMPCFMVTVSYIFDRAIAQAVSRQLPTAAAWVRDQVRWCICGGQSGIRVGFLRILRSPLPILIPPAVPHSSSSGAGKIGQLMADVPSGLSLIPPQETKKKKEKEITGLTSYICSYQSVNHKDTYKL